MKRSPFRFNLQQLLRFLTLILFVPVIGMAVMSPRHGRTHVQNAMATGPAHLIAANATSPTSDLGIAPKDSEDDSSDSDDEPDFDDDISAIV